MVHAADGSCQKSQEVFHSSLIPRAGSSRKSRHVCAVDARDERTGQLASDGARIRLSAACASEKPIGVALRSGQAEFTTTLICVFAFRPTQCIGVGPQRSAISVGIWKCASVADRTSEL